MLAQLPAVITDKHRDRLVSDAELIHRIENSAHQMIREGSGRVVRAPCVLSDGLVDRRALREPEGESIPGALMPGDGWHASRDVGVRCDFDLLYRRVCRRQQTAHSLSFDLKSHLKTIKVTDSDALRHVVCCATRLPLEYAGG